MLTAARVVAAAKAPKVRRFSRTRTEISASAPTTPKGEAQKAAALQALDRGEKVFNVYSPSSSVSSSTAPVVKAVRQTKARQVKAQREAKQQAKAVQAFIAEEPRKAASALTEKTRTLVKRSDLKVARPKVELVERGKPLEVKGQKVVVNAKTAAKILSPDNPKLEKTLIQKVKQVKEPTKPKKIAVEVPEIVPPKMRKAVAKHGQRLNDALKQAGSELTGPEYLAKLVEFESGWNPTAENPSSAYGYGQFIDSTAQDFRERLGVETQDPSKPVQMLKGASLHASGKAGYGALYAGYNPGYSDTDPIPAVESGQNVKVKIKAKAAKKAAGGEVATSGSSAAGTTTLKGTTPRYSGTSTKPVPVKQLRKAIQFTEADSEVASELGVPESEASLMATGMVPKMQRALVALAKRTGTPVRLNEGYRTVQRANDFPSGTGSNHHKGLAADVDNNAAYTAEDLAAVGLNNTNVGGEPWHFELNEPQGTTAAIGGTSSASYAPTGVVPASTSGASATVSPASSKRKTDKKRKAKRVDNSARQALIREIIAEGPAVAPTVEVAAPAVREKVSLGL